MHDRHRACKAGDRACTQPHRIASGLSGLSGRALPPPPLLHCAATKGPTDAAVGCFDSFSAVHNYQEPSLNQVMQSPPLSAAPHHACTSAQARARAPIPFLIPPSLKSARIQCYRHTR